MNTLLLFFALPVATTILAVVVEKIIRNPFLTALTFFAIYLIVTFSVFDTSFLVYAIIYTMIAFVTAIIANFFFRRYRCGILNKCCMNNIENTTGQINTISLTNQDITRIANRIIDIQNCNGNFTNSSNTDEARKIDCVRDVATVDVTNNTTGGRTKWCCYRR